MKTTLITILIFLPTCLLASDSDKLVAKIKRTIAILKLMETPEFQEKYDIEPEDITWSAEELARDIVALAMFGPATDETLKVLEDAYASDTIGDIVVSPDIMLPFEYYEHYMRVFSPGRSDLVGSRTIEGARTLWTIIDSATLTVKERAKMKPDDAGVGELFTHRLRALGVSE